MKSKTPKLKEQVLKYKIIILGFILAFIYLMIEAIIDVYIFEEYDYFYQDFLTTDVHEISSHITIVCFIIFLGFFCQILITKQQLTAQKLRESEEWYSTTLRSIGDAVITTDTNGNITFLNKVAETITGWKSKEALGRPVVEIFKIINELTRDNVEDPVERVIKEGIVVGLANHSILIAKDGTEIPIDDSGAPIKDEEGNLIGVILIFRDITDRKKAEEAERDALKARQEKLVMLGQLAGGVGHELRNPLGAIKNATYFLKMALEDPEQDIKETLEVLDKEINISEMIINSLLGFARPKTPLLQKTDINDMVENLFSRIAIPENIEVLKDLDESLPSILVDPDQLTSIFGNIITNAIQAMREGGQLIVKTKISSPGWMAISFSDSGTGISKENIKKLFEPLFTTKAKGIGLGLAIAKIMVEAHEGTIDVESQVGKGSTFTVRLPFSGKGDN